MKSQAKNYLQFSRTDRWFALEMSHSHEKSQIQQEGINEPCQVSVRSHFAFPITQLTLPVVIRLVQPVLGCGPGRKCERPCLFKLYCRPYCPFTPCPSIPAGPRDRDIRHSGDQGHRGKLLNDLTAPATLSALWNIFHSLAPLDKNRHF